jgi:hypothetical protein
MKYIASMTTYPQRFEYALEVIKLIEKQTKKPKALVINISEEDWHQAELNFIHQAKFLFSNHLIILPCINLKPANKIIPTAQKHGDEIIITFDDDVRYPLNRAEELLNNHYKYPENPIAYRTRLVEFEGESVSPYSTWAISYNSSEPNKLNFPTSVSGSLYPANFFTEDFFDIESYIYLSHDNDDIWTYFHVLLKGSSFIKAGNEVVPPGFSGSQNSALWKRNVSKGGNDAIILKLEKKYGSLWKLTGENSL